MRTYGAAAREAEERPHGPRPASPHESARLAIAYVVVERLSDRLESPAPRVARRRLAADLAASRLTTSALAELVNVARGARVQ